MHIEINNRLNNDGKNRQKKNHIYMIYMCVYIYIFKEKRNYEKRDKYYDFDMILYLYYL